MLSLLRILSPNTWLLVGAIAASSAAAWRVTSWMYQAEISDMRADKARAAQQAAESNRRVEQLAGELSQALSERLADKQEKQKVITKVVTKEVIRYVKGDSIVVDRFVVNPEWLRVHDIAASGRVPENADATGGADEGAGDTEVLELVTENYATCQDNRQRQIALQTWAASLKNLH